MNRIMSSSFRVENDDAVAIDITLDRSNGSGAWFEIEQEHDYPIVVSLACLETLVVLARKMAKENGL